MTAIDDVLARIDANLPEAIERVMALCRIPSVSTDPHYAPACREAAQWLADELARTGFTAEVKTTRGHPIVIGHARASRPDAPHLLFYGHYDVQPADPLELWTTPPFEPRLEGDGDARRLVARGAADDKGQLMTFVEACRAYHESGGIPCHITVMFEGEEECGSGSLPAFLVEYKHQLEADLLMLCDTSMWDARTPAITATLRGLMGMEVIVHGAARDLHSGLFGGPAINPIRVLARIIGDLHDADGCVTIAQFYEGVEELPPGVAAQWHGLRFDEDKFLGDVGLSVPAGERNRSVLEMIWARPTAEVNGIVGGYTGAGGKTVIPARASAKFTFRLVGHQAPEAIARNFRAFVEARLPGDCRAEFIAQGQSPALQLPFASPALLKAEGALAQEWGCDPVLVASGGSIPVVGAIKASLGMDALMIGFGLEDDRIHSPNEKYDLKCFHKGTRSWARVLDALGA